MPQLTTAYGTVDIQGAPNLTTLDLTKLNTVTQNFKLGRLEKLTALNIGGLASHANIQGSVLLTTLTKIPWTAVDQLTLPARTDDSVLDVGCCLSAANQHACTTGGYVCN